MSITTLQITNLRNIKQAELTFSPGLNLIHGDNGSGKSTLLEAIYLIARGRSYRTARFGSVIRHGEGSASLYATSQTTRNHRIGIQKTAKQTRVRIDGKEITKLSEIARTTPLQIVTPMSHEILERGPEYRRRFIEWGVFHVEHNHFSLYRQFMKNLRQRNKALREQVTSLASWNAALVKQGEALNNMRESYFQELIRRFDQHAQMLGLALACKFFWKPGWSASAAYGDVLLENQESDIKRGFTQFGPHRADFRLTIDERSAFNTASRGQQKMIIVALHLAQASILREKTGTVPVILIDDLVSELDQKNRTALVEYLSTLGMQVFITSTESIPSPGDIDLHRFAIAAGHPVQLG